MAPTTRRPIDMAEQIANKNRIINTLLNFDIEIETIKATVGQPLRSTKLFQKRSENFQN
jgi:hypothetical protein